MTSRPFAADDFDAIRARMIELQQTKQNAVAAVALVDVHYKMLPPGRIRIWCLSPKAQKTWNKPDAEPWEGNCSGADSFRRTMAAHGITGLEI